MNPADELSEYYAELLEGRYDCLDRIVINAFYSLGQTGGGMRTWWRRLYGGDEHLTEERLRDMAGNFSRRVRAYCQQNAIALVEAEAGERKDQLAQPYLPKDPSFQGVFLVITGKAPAPVWEVHRNAKGQIVDLRRPRNWPYAESQKGRIYTYYFSGLTFWG